MGYCKDCIYYDVFGDCTLQDQARDDYDSCDDFKSKWYYYYDDDDNGDGKDDLFEIFIDPAGSIENFMGLE